MESVIRSSLDNAIREAAMESDTRVKVKMEVDANPFRPAPLPSDPDDLLNEMKEYLGRTALILHRLTENLVKGPHIDALAREVHQIARDQTRFSDMSRISCRDVQLGKIRYDIFYLPRFTLSTKG